MDKQSRTGPTPGPWLSQRQDVVTPSGMLIATAWSMRGVDKDGRTMDPYFTDPNRINATTADANARLIAAAPELLAFVEDVEDYLVCMGYDPETADPESTGVQHVLTARALLVKVRP